MGANGNINDLELAKFIELAGQYGIRVHILHGDSWLPSVANLAALPATGNTTGDIRQTLDTGTPYRWNGTAWIVWSTSGTSWGTIAGTLSAQTDLQAALDAKMGAGAYVLVSQESLLINQINLGALTSGILKQTVSAGVATISILTDNSGNWNTSYTHSQTTSGNPHNVTKTEVGLGNVDNTSDVNKPVSTAQAAADTAALNTAKAYADGLVVGLLDDRGNYNASVNTFPASGGSGTAGAILKGDLWTVSVAGTLGGVAVTPGDLVRAIVDTPGQTSTNWALSETNIGYTAENQANKATTMTGNEASNTLYLSAKAIYDWAVGLFVQKNGAITGATKTKITYDAKGLVTAGADATTADIADSADKRYVTDAEKTKLANTSNTNSGDETLASIGTKMFTATGKTTPVDADGFSIFDSAASNVLKTLTFTNLKAFLKTWIDSLTTTFTNKTIALGNNTVSGTKAQFDTAVTDGNIMYIGDAPTAHTQNLSTISDVTITVANLNSLDDGVNTALHFHDADRARSAHTGTQASITISDFTEAAQDATGAMVDTSLVYTDATPLLQRAALSGAITASVGSNTTALGSFTTAQLNTALSDNDIATGGGTATGSNTGDNSANTNTGLVHTTGNESISGVKKFADSIGMNSITPSAWSIITVIETDLGFIGQNTLTGGIYYGTNCYYNGTNWIYKTTASASLVTIDPGTPMLVRYASSGTAGTTITWTTIQNLTSAGVLTLAGIQVPTISSIDTLTNKTLTTPAIASIKGTITADTDGATITFNKNASDFHSVTLAGNRTLALSNMATGDRIILRLQQDATGSRIPTWFTTIKWVGGTAPTLTTTPSKADMFGFLCTSAGNYDGFVIGQNI